jgi:hypothetical protein
MDDEQNSPECIPADPFLGEPPVDLELDEGQRAAFVEVLGNPPSANPVLRRLMRSRPPWL